MRTNYRRWLNVTWDNAIYRDVETLAAGRNAVVHGLGALTKQQKRGGAVALRRNLQELGFKFTPLDRLIIDAACLKTAAHRCRRFIEHVDERVANRPSTHR